MFFIQHGYGKGLKIGRIAGRAPVDGVILSPAHEDAVHLRETATACKSIGLQVLLDPQTFIYSLTPQGAARHHASHGIELTDLHWSQTGEAVKKHVDAVLDANLEVGTTGPTIAPSPFQASLDNFWMPVALQYGRTASDAWGGENSYVSLILDEATLHSWTNIEGWIDILTTLDVAGFYLLVNRSRSQYPATAWDPNALANLLRLIYTLSEINEYDVIWAYSDIDGLLGLTVGATAIASGWSYGLRAFSTARWNEKRAGGAPTVPRIYFGKLWAPLRGQEAADLHSTDIGRAQFSRALAKHFETNTFESWSIVEAQEHHLATLATRASRISSLGDVGERVDRVAASLDKALSAYAQIAAEGVTLDNRYLNQVRAYAQALDLFRSAESL